MIKPKFFFITTIPGSLSFFNGQYQLLQQDFDITAISSQRQQLEQFGEQQGIKVHYIHMEREISLLKDILGLCRFIIFFIKERPSVIHGNTPKGSLLSMLASWIVRVPVRIYMCHGLRYQGCTGFKRRLLMQMERISCKCATHVICVSKGVSEVLIEDKITNKRPILIWNGSVRGIDTNKFDPKKDFDKVGLKKKLGINAGDFVLTFVGRIVKDKGINELVEAFVVLSSLHPNMKLLLIGRMEMTGNPISEQTKETIQCNPAIIATGPQSDIPSFLSITDLFVFPSYREGFGLSLMEAGAMGVPSIATNIIGCSEVIEEGKTGLLIPAHSSSAIVEAVERLYNDKELYDTLRLNSRDSIVNRYEQKALWNMYRDYYVRLADDVRE